MDMLSGFLSAIKPQKDGDMVDRLNYYYSTILLTVFAIFISGWSFVGQPIQCWFPAYYRGWWVEYAIDYCYVQNTYFLPFTEEPAKNYWELGRTMVQIPQNVTKREDTLLGYYQWVPFVLALEAICFYLPVVIWRSLYGASGIKVKDVCDTAANVENMSPETRKKNVKTIAAFMDHSWKISEQLHGGKKSFMVGRYVSSLYLLVQFMFAINCLGQFFMLQHFLGLPNFYWGAEVLVHLVRGETWAETGNFPRVTLCDFEVRVLGNLHRHTVQCVLMINMFNEKIFVFLWWWFCVVCIFSTISFLYWCITLLVQRFGERIITNYLHTIDKDIAKSVKRQGHVRRFLEESLKPDGIFLLRMIAANAGDIVASELLESLWNAYKKKHNIGASSQKSSTSKPPALPEKAPLLDEAPTDESTPSFRPFPPRYQDLTDSEARQRKPPTQPLTETGL